MQFAVTYLSTPGAKDHTGIYIIIDPFYIIIDPFFIIIDPFSIIKSFSIIIDPFLRYYEHFWAE